MIRAEESDINLINLSKKYWNKIAHGEYERINFSKRASEYVPSKNEINVDIDGEVFNKIVKTSRNNDLIIYLIMLATFKITIAKYFQNNKFLIGIPQYIESEDMESTNEFIILDNNIIEDNTFKQALVHQKNQTFEAYKHQFYPVKNIYKINDIYDSVNVYCCMKNIHNKKQIEDILALGNNDFTLNIEKYNNSIKLIFNYCNKSLMDEVNGVKSAFINILSSVSLNMNSVIKDIEILSEEERSILEKFNDTEGEYPEGKVVSELFEMQVERTPDNIAVVYENQSLTYKELNERANSLGRTLTKKGVGADSIVGIMVKRSLEMIVGIMGILKAGGAYMPIDPEYPDDRIEYMLENSETKLVLVENKFKDRINKNNVEVCGLNDEELYKESNANLGKIASAENLAYVIYTSGTTGKPKGVMIEHKGIVNRINWMQKKYNISSKDVILQKTTYTFDVSVWEILWWSFVGAQVRMLVPGGEKDPREITKSIKEGKITVLHFVPSMLNVFMDYVISEDKVEDIESLEKVFTSGEALKVEQANIFNEEIGRVNNTRLINLYGPTEASVDVTYYECMEKEEKIPIGKPIDNTKIYIVDKNNKMLPIGVAGELCISGCGVARGYLNNEKLTNEKFAQNPYEPGEKMYRTGDLARWLPDGNIEYLGRIDHQVKIRGFRIELGEIESNILKLEGIKETIVLARDGAVNKYLCAYYAGEKEYSVGEFREELKKSMPDYMVPSYFIKLESMPLTLNGKINRKALPEPQGKIDTGAEYEAPRNEIEQKLVQIWEDVLGVQDIGINDDFFSLGGDSLSATTLTGRIFKVLNVEVPLKEIFNNGNIKGLSEYIETISSKQYQAIEKVDEKQYYEVSSAQKRMYMLQELDQKSTAYNIPGALEILGDFDIKRMQEVFIKLIERHETLRTSFYTKADKIVQRINKANEIQFEIEKIEIKNEEEVKEKFEEFIRPFDLEKAPLLRVEIIKLEKERHIMFFDMHHIVSDGVSMSILTREFSDLYEGEDLGELKVQYKDYSAWQLKKRESKEFKKQEQYWLKEFSEEVPVLSLPTDYKRPRVKDFRGRSINFVLDKETTEKLKKIAKETGSTMYMLLMANINILLSKYSGQEDIIIGSPIAGRNHVDLENVIGMFVNTLAIRSSVNGEASFKEYLKTVKSKALKAFENQDYQFEELVDKIDVDRDLSRNPLFDVMFVLQNMEETKVEINDLVFRTYNTNDNVEKFDITITAKEREEEIYFNLSYATSLYKYETIERMKKHLLNIIEETGQNAETKIKDIELIDEEEKHKLLIEFNDTKASYPRGKTINELFEEEVEKTPDNIAVVFEDKKLTYKELNERANSLGRTLTKKGVGADSIVGIMVKRSLEMIVGIMGILKAGGAYMPIDPEYPDDRIEYMLENSETKLVLVENKFKDRINKNNVEVCGLNDEELYKESNANLGKTASAENLAYVIYTSGTTGKPKGVMIEHKGIVNRINWMQKKYNISSKDVILQKTTYTFDVSVWEILWWSFVGAQVRMLVPGGEKDPREITKSIKEGKITVLHFVPSMLNVFMDYVISEDKVEDIESLEKVFTSGEALKVEQANIFNEEIGRVNNTRLINLYGPTEASVDVTYYECREKEEKIPIGKPIDNTKIYIVDKNNKMLPIGVAGELCISGCGVARGYLNNEKLTNEKFAQNPYEPGEKMYRTGDLARWLPDGNIEYLGRIDHQVKIRGFRIELGEIESNILKLEGIKETIVLARDGAVNKYLCAYYAGEKEYSVGEFREELKKSMPDYMVPSYFIKLESMPLTLNGKINRKALPEPQGKIDTGAEYEAPRNEIEQKLVQIWEDVLGVQDIGINDDFFSLGGDSIKSIQVISRAKAKGYYFEVKDVFNNSNIKALSKCVKKNAVTISQDEVVGEVELTPIQKWFFEMNFEEEHHWNQSVMLFSKDGFEKEALEKAFEAIIIHHDALRMVYKKENGEVHQINRGTSEKLYDLNVYEGLNEKEITEKCDEIQGSINLHDGPLVKLGLFKTHEGDHLLVAIHHLVIDGVSWRILFEDLSRAYEMTKNGEDIILQDKTTSFKEWAVEQKKYADSYSIRKQLEYWNGIDKYEIRKLPKDKEAAVSRIKDLRSVGFNLTKEETEKLLKHVNKAYNTEIEDLLLTALALTISKWTGEENILVNLECHGREEIIKNVDITRTVGWFTSQYPVVLNSNSDDLETTIKNIKDSLRRVPDKGIGYGIIKYLSKDKMEFRLKPEISFNYLGQFDEDINNDIFNMSPLSSGNSIGLNNKGLYSLDFSGILVDKCLNLNLGYSTTEYKDETIRTLVNDYKDNLEKIIKHCMNKDKAEKTAADVTKENITLQQLKPYLKDIDNIKNIYPLAPMQEGMLYHTLYDNKSEAYNEELVIKVKGQLDIDLLKQSFNKLVERHDILRTAFDYENFNRNMQIVFYKRKANVRYVDISHEKFDKEDYIDKAVKNDKKQGFDLNKDVLIKLTIIKTEEDVYNLILNNHHIIMDGWCLNIVMLELFKIYNELKYGYKADLKEAVPYYEYIEWLNNKDRDAAKEYWRKYLLDYNEVTAVPFENKESSKEYKKEEINFNIGKDITRKLEAIARNSKVTINTIIQSVWSVLLNKYNNSSDSVFGYVVSGRNPEVKGIENMLGLFINTVPLRVKAEGNMTFKELLTTVNKSFLESSKYDFYPLAEIQGLSEVKEKLVNNIMIFENYPVDTDGINNEVLTKNNLKIIGCKSQEQTNYNFNLTVIYQDTILIKFKFNKLMYSRNNVLKIKNYFESLINQVIDNTEVLIKDIEIVRKEEKYKLLMEFNDTKVDYPREKTINELFEENVKKAPDNIAVVYEDKKLTYKELNERANSLGITLMKKGVGADAVVGIMVQRSLEMIVGIMGILKAGGAYMPIDPEYPENRIEYMIENSKAEIVLTQSKFKEKIKNEKIDVCDLEDEEFYKEDRANIGKTASAKNLAYVIYTSGTTGKPKGVMIEHSNVTNLVHGLNESIYSKYNDNLKIALVAPYVFDASVKQIFCALLLGNTLYVVTEAARKEGDKLVEFYLNNKIEITDGTPMHLAMMANSELLTNKNLKLKNLIIGGDKLTRKIIEKIYKKVNNKELIISNVYGPTECCVDAACNNITINNLKNYINMPLGKPIDNVRIYIVDKNNKLMPIGAAGELCISGYGLSRGYLNNKELTEEKFVANPYEPGQKMYKTGDLARWLPDGTIECLGRIDYQVKIRGFRIEIGEIENTLLKLEGIKETVVDAKGKEESKRLCAYYVGEKEYRVGELREELKKSLPDYMLPSYFIKIDKMPLTINGKVDRKALPEPQGKINTGAEYEAARNEMEEKLVKIWEDVLGIRNVGINDNFFELGGNSIKLVDLLVKMKKQLILNVTMDQLFTNPTIKDICNLLYSDLGEGGKFVTRLSYSGGKNIFAFPPAIGYGYSYLNLVNRIDNYSIYAFSFIDNANIIDEYVKSILDTQNEGPFILLGYSGGGNLAFEVAKVLEKKGYEVSDIIMLDSAVKKSVKDNLTYPSKYEVISIMKNFFNIDNFHEFEENIAERAMVNHKKYIQYNNKNITKEKVKANIYVISSSSTREVRENYEYLLNWENHTMGKFVIYDGYGLHLDMLSGEYCGKNAEILKNILAE
ncbi:MULTISPECIES: non-ribosomal peptide synthetase [Clostridium]|uniref:non-ribosomal peptide synthetase n=1 Tax=Clostridium TaxID=1485 RepID=UPI000825D0E9|nr:MULTISPECIES: non-ribosomal peptide synthetase [Clostridium]PJI07373.1 non-ribosomal peptide synthetase [Clostridium sp. CT7]